MFYFIQLSTVLSTGRSEDRGVDLGIVVCSHPVIRRVDDGVSDALDRDLFGSSEIQMSVVEQKLYAVFFLT